MPDHRIPIFDAKGNMRGTVGHKATSATVSRFTGTHNNSLVQKDGRDAWVANTAPNGSGQCHASARRPSWRHSFAAIREV